MSSEAVQPVITERTPEESVEQIMALMEGPEKNQERPEMPPRGFISTSKGRHFSCSPRQPDPIAKRFATSLLNRPKTPTTPKLLTQGRAKIGISMALQGQKTTPTARAALPQQNPKVATPLRAFVQTPPNLKAPSHPQVKMPSSPPPSKAQLKEPLSRIKEEHRGPRENKQKALQKTEERKEGIVDPQAAQRDIRDPAEKKRAIEAVRATESGLKEIEAFATESSPLSELAGERITQRDILFLFFEILKLFQTSKELQKEASRVLREQHLVHIDRLTEQYETQGSTLLNAALGAGVIGIVGGFAPIFGQLSDGWLFDKLATWIKRLKNLTPEQRNDWYTWIGTASKSMSEGQMQWGQASVRVSEGESKLEEALGQLCRSDEEECTRIIQEYLEQWRRISEFLEQYLRMQHDTATRL